MVDRRETRRRAWLGAQGAWVSLLLLTPLPAFVQASAAAAEKSPGSPSSEAELTGEQIYERSLENRFYAYVHEVVMESGDRSTNLQKTELEMKYLSFRGTDEAEKVLSKSIAKYTEPNDVRHLGYLVIKKADDSEDQFIYRPSARRVRRINLRGESVFGTDFSMEDILPREVEDATYNRIADSEVDGIPVFSVEVFPKPEKDSNYSKFVVFVEKEHYVAIRTYYWDENDVKIKELNATHSSIEKFEGVDRAGAAKQIWVPRDSRMVQLQTGTFTTLHVDDFRIDQKLRDRDFSQRKLTSGR